MRIAYFHNAKLEAEVLDGNLTKLHNLSERERHNLCGDEPFTNGRLAIVFDDFDGDRQIIATIDLDE